MPFLKIDDVVDVVVSTAAAATPRAGFNTGLILGKSTRITSEDRCKIYSSPAAMLDDGFTEDAPEYKAAVMYFSQDPAPSKVIIGVCANNETWVQAMTACRAVNSSWYAVYCAGTERLALAEHQANATYVETFKGCYFYDDAEADDLTSADTDVFSVIKKLSLKRNFPMYSATMYAAAAAMGFAMGANNGTANSAYTMAYKELVGVAPDDLSETQVAALQGKNANYYVVRGGTYNVLEKGVTGNGTWFDELIGLDQLANDIQIGCMDVLAKTKTKIPYTDAGALNFVLACNEACDNAVRRGFLAPGIWTKEAILNLAKGDTLEKGFLCQAEPVANQAASAKSLRICPPIYVSANMAGAIHSVTIKVDVV